MKTDTLTDNKYSFQKTGQYQNRSNLIYNDGNGRCAVIEHYYQSEKEQKELEEKIIKGLNNYDSLLNALKEAQKVILSIGMSDFVIAALVKKAIKKATE